MEESLLQQTLKRMWIGNYVLAIIAGCICSIVLSLNNGTSSVTSNNTSMVPLREKLLSLFPNQSKSNLSFNSIIPNNFYIGGEIVVFDIAIVSLLICYLV